MNPYQNIAKEHLTGGIVYVRTKDKNEVVCVGYRDRANKLEVNEDTRFPTASVGKIFTAIGILQLIEQGRLSLETTIGSVLSFDLNQVDPEVTIEQLLTHTSGIPDYCDESIFPDYADLWKEYPNYKIRSGKDLLPLFLNREMTSEKGTVTAYNNSAFTLLGIILEEVSGQPFDQYLQEHLFDPLQMDQSGYFELDKLPGNTAIGYIPEEEGTYHSNIYSIDAKGSGAGGAYTTVGDMDRFWQGLFAGKVLKSGTLKDMMTPRSKLEGHQYGLGVWLDDTLCPFVVGMDPGSLSESWYDSTNDRQISVFSNHEDNIFPLVQMVKEIT